MMTDMTHRKQWSAPGPIARRKIVIQNQLPGIPKLKKNQETGWICSVRMIFARFERQHSFHETGRADRNTISGQPYTLY